MAWAALCLCPLFASATEVGLAGVMGSRALLMVDGAPPRTVGVGQSLGGVRVVSVAGDQVVVEIDGKKRPLRVGQNASSAGPAANAEGGEQKAILLADSAGHFVTTGAINGSAVRFLVDTGASMVSLGASDAQRVGIDARKGELGRVQTANGVVNVYRVKLNSVQVGGVTLHNVDATVHTTDLPVVLLGMSFLNRMEMVRDGATMTLKKRF